MSNKPKLRKYSEVRPTKADADETGKVMAIYDDFHDCTDFPWESRPSGYKYWCRVKEWQAHMESLINGDTDEEDSGWVYAKDRWPTEKDGEFVLWMSDSWSRPQVCPFLDFNQHSHAYRHNLRWHRLPPEPPKKPRELPALSAVYDDGELARYATLRDGTHVHIMDRNNLVTYLIVRNQYHSIIVVNNDGYFQADKAPNEHDIVHVGGWLSKEELEALKNG